MPELSHRLAVAAIFLVGLSTLAGLATGEPAATLPGQHHRWIVGMLGLALVVSARLPALRLPAAAVGVLAKGAFLGLLLSQPQTPWSVSEWVQLAEWAALVAAGAVLLRELRQERRWDGALAWRPASGLTSGRIR